MHTAAASAYFIVTIYVDNSPNICGFFEPPVLGNGIAKINTRLAKTLSRSTVFGNSFVVAARIAGKYLDPGKRI